MLGSSDSIACANIMLNTSVAEELKQFADELEGAKDFHAALSALIKRVIKEHGRIIFNGNGYDEKWVKEAEKRGLLNLKTTPDAIARYLDEKNVKLFTSHGVLSETEMKARQEIGLEHYSKVIDIEAKTMVDMAVKQIFPAVAKFTGDLAALSANKKAYAPVDYEESVVKTLSELLKKAYGETEKLKAAVKTAESEKTEKAKAEVYKSTAIPAMEFLRATCDEMETLTAKDYWPMPGYTEILYSVR